jgi:hypothetical protein
VLLLGSAGVPLARLLRSVTYGVQRVTGLVDGVALLGVVIGWLGLLLATPITATVAILVRKLYEAPEGAGSRRRLEAA